MAVENEESTEYTNSFTTTPAVFNPPSDTHGRLRIAFFTHAQAVAGSATSDIAIAKLPAGKVRLLGKLCNLYVNWTTASATLDCGWAAYTDNDGAAVAASIAGIDNGIDVDAVGAQVLGSALAATGYTKEFISNDGVTIKLTSTDTAIALGDDAVGYLVYVVD